MTIKKPLVLIVDDEPSAMELLRNFVASPKLYEIIEAKSGSEALEISRKHARFLGFGRNNISVIVLDHRLPDDDTHSFLRKLTKLGKSYAKIPVITCSAISISSIQLPNWLGQVDKTDREKLLTLLQKTCNTNSKI